MRTIAILIAVAAFTGIALAQDQAPRSERVVLKLIQLKYLDVATAARLFGGTIISTSGYSGGQYAAPRGPRGGYGYARSGSRVGGGYTSSRNYGYQPQTGYGTQDPNTYGNAGAVPGPTRDTFAQPNTF